MAVRCQRIGCNSTFTDESNTEDSCRYHPGPLFHDGGKEWKCCKQRSHDFSLFMDIPGCTTGKHTSEKPQPLFTSSAKKPTITPIGSINTTTVTREACPRCRQGFFCSDHGSQPTVKSIPQLYMQTPSISNAVKKSEPEEIGNERPRVADFNAKQTCKNCKKTFTESVNHDTACLYHPGPPIFHDRSRGWSCCNIHVKEFDEFLEIPPCTKGWHCGS
ncbi:hypothetical protein KP509_17G016600 [Ceratopteris richardii]|uniref:CHORD domain-containing protein n=1 Tax=Ceratopteris richardii TaxID=49495 RepID=A0A8T2SVW4_CERRI|nr:hypothetical protein KP509_17G016600 [Ceratopteris richardii]KAH7372687.1 hypothetical protein KP509_17G016600 [Ceratopteris richardii]KAH7372688.1 hypothetical protein KP509_17G016600 [Ceratopteris richardii]